MTEYVGLFGGDVVALPKPVLYTGGAIDYDLRARAHEWRHVVGQNAPEWDIYCPICANADKPAVETLMLRNMQALLTADLALFLLDGAFTVGTPVEIHLRMQNRPRTVGIVHPGKPGAFVQTWAKAGAIVFSRIDEVYPWLRA